MTLLEKARQAASGRALRCDTDIQGALERVELAVAYLAGSITSSQASAVLGCKTSSVNSILGGAIMTALRARVITIHWVNEKEGE